jgi:hypothetical protein
LPNGTFICDQISLQMTARGVAGWPLRLAAAGAARATHGTREPQELLG